MNPTCECEYVLNSEVTQTLGINNGSLIRLVKMFVIRSIAAFRWVLPGTLLLIIPKCPLCFAAYVLVGSGIGLSLTSAAILREALILACAILLLHVCVKWVRVRYLRSICSRWIL